MPIKRLPPPKIITYDEPESEDFFDSNLPEVPTPKQDGHVWKVPYVTPHKLGDKGWMVKYLVEHWDHYNATLFEGKMKRPLIYMSNAIAAERFRNRGMYYGGPGYTAGKIRMSPNLFGPEDHKYVDETLQHEMCHQYVWHVLHINDRTEAGHGPAWQAEMIRIGLKPSRYDESGNDVYMKEKVREAYLEKNPTKRAASQLREWGFTLSIPKPILGEWCASYNNTGVITYSRYVATIPTGLSKGLRRTLVDPVKRVNLTASTRAFWRPPVDWQAPNFFSDMEWQVGLSADLRWFNDYYKVNQ